MLMNSVRGNDSSVSSNDLTSEQHENSWPHLPFCNTLLSWTVWYHKPPIFLAAPFKFHLLPHLSLLTFQMLEFLRAPPQALFSSLTIPSLHANSSGALVETSCMNRWLPNLVLPTALSSWLVSSNAYVMFPTWMSHRHLRYYEWKIAVLIFLPNLVLSPVLPFSVKYLPSSTQLLQSDHSNPFLSLTQYISKCGPFF